MTTSHESLRHSQVRLPAPASVLALHCSGSSGRQWDPLAKRLAPSVKVIAPDLYGAGQQNSWIGQGPFSLADEAARIISLVDEIAGPVHLIGHSYGGAVALKVALARPLRIASLSLYEPVAFHVLRSMGPEGCAPLQQIEELAALFNESTLTGDYVKAARHFVDFWSGEGSWEAIKPGTRAQLMQIVPKGCLEFRAVLRERTPLVAYARLRIPALLLQGEALNPAALVTRKLSQVMRPARFETLSGAGHMGPVTHAEQVNDHFAAHIMQSVIEDSGPLRLAA